MHCTYITNTDPKGVSIYSSIDFEKTSFWMARTAQLKIKWLLDLLFAGSIARKIYMIGGLIVNIISGVVEDSVTSKFDSHL